MCRDAGALTNPCGKKLPARERRYMQNKQWGSEGEKRSNNHWDEMLTSYLGLHILRARNAVTIRRLLGLRRSIELGIASRDHDSDGRAATM